MARRKHAKDQNERQHSAVAKALGARRESKAVEFKSEFNLGYKGAWCEVLKDIVAIANSGGGVIAFGVEGAGHPSGADMRGVLALDPAEVADKIHAYTGVHFADLEIVDVAKDGHQLAILVVSASETPIVFTKPGTYDVGGSKQKTAFSKGTVYFRHGAKSEPGTTADIARAIERRLEVIRREWLSGVRRVVQAPPGSQLSVLPPEIRDSNSPDAIPIRVVDDPTAPAYRIVDLDQTHPLRQKELVTEVRKRLPQGVVFNQFDFRQSARQCRMLMMNGFAASLAMDLPSTATSLWNGSSVDTSGNQTSFNKFAINSGWHQKTCRSVLIAVCEQIG